MYIPNNVNSLILTFILLLVLFIIFSDSAAQRGLWPPRPRGFLITHNDAPHSVGLLWRSYQPVAESSTWQHTQQTTMPPVGFEPTIAAGERP
jgi:hypothetical protein